jgi:hypothetical protein
VRTGADAVVLASLNTLCKANELEVCRTYVDGRSNATMRRRKLFAHGEPYDCTCSTVTPKCCFRHPGQEPAARPGEPELSVSRGSCRSIGEPLRPPGRSPCCHGTFW